MLAFNIVTLVLLGVMLLGAVLIFALTPKEDELAAGFSLIVGLITAVAIAALALNMARV